MLVVVCTTDVDGMDVSEHWRLAHRLMLHEASNLNLGGGEGLARDCHDFPMEHVAFRIVIASLDQYLPLKAHQNLQF